MVKEYEQTQPSGRYLMHDHLDVLDETGKWMNGEVIEVSGNKVKIRFSGFSSKFDVWLEDNSERLLKQWRPGQDFQINNRLDVLDGYNIWKEACIIDMNQTQIKIKYRGYADKYNEWIHKTSSRIQVIGSKSRAFGIGRLDPSNNYRYGKKDVQTDGNKFLLEANKEKRFSLLLQSKSMSIVPVIGDGNCLFRSVSHQLYASEDYHQIIRETALNYISVEREYFSQFIVGGIERIDEYIHQMSQNGAWGDDIEIQAMSEIYNKPFHIFVYSNIPIRSFHEDQGEGKPIRLAYHGSCHYNSIEETGKHEREILLNPGVYEQGVMARVNTDEFRSNLLRNRVLFEEIMKSDLEQAVRESLESFDGDDLMLRQALEISMKATEDYEINLNDEEMLKHAIEMSQNEDDMLMQALEASKKEAVPEAVIFVMNSGFTLEQAMTAWQMCGDNPNVMIDFICSELM